MNKLTIYGIYTVICLLSFTLPNAHAQIASVGAPKISVSEVHFRDVLQKIHDYCFEHADRAASGEAVVNDLIKAGLVDSQYYDMTCSSNELLMQTCSIAFAQKFGRDPYYDFEFNICPKMELNNVTK